MDMDEVREKILGLRIMNDLDEEFQGKLADIFQEISAPRSVPVGGIFIHQGEHVDNKGYILVSGAVLVKKEGFPDLVCKAPELVGEIMQFNPAGIRTATCAGAKESVVLRFQWDDFWKKAEERFTTDEIEKLRDVLESQAWEHFLR